MLQNTRIYRLAVRICVLISGFLIVFLSNPINVSASSWKKNSTRQYLPTRVTSYVWLFCVSLTRQINELEKFTARSRINTNLPTLRPFTAITEIAAHLRRVKYPGRFESGDTCVAELSMQSMKIFFPDVTYRC